MRSKIKKLLPAVILAAGLALAASAVAQPDPGPEETTTAPAAPEAAPAAAPSDAPAEAPAAPAPAAAPEPSAGETPAEAAPVAVPVPVDVGEAINLLGRIGREAMGGNYTLAALLALVLLAFGIRAAAGTKVFRFLRWFRTRWGGWTLVFIGTTSGMLATTVGGGGGAAALDFRTVQFAVLFGLAGSGFWQLVKDKLKLGGSGDSG